MSIIICFWLLGGLPRRKPGWVGNFAPTIRSTMVATIVIANGRWSPQVIWVLSSPCFKKIPLRRAPKSKL